MKMKHVRITLMASFVFVLAFAILIGTGILAFILDGASPFAVGSTLWLIWKAFATLVGIVAAIVLVWLVNRFALQNLLPSLFDRSRLPGIASIAFWIAFTVLLLSALIVFYAVLGALDVEYPGEVTLVFAIVLTFISMLFAGFVEELVFRYLFYGYLKTQLPVWLAILISGAVFGAAHLNQVTNVADAVLLIIAAIAVTTMFVAIYERTGSIWPGAIVHTVWNMTTGVSGISFTNLFESSTSDFEYLKLTITSESTFLSGGDFGPESSVVAIVFYLTAALLVWQLPAKFRVA